MPLVIAAPGVAPARSRSIVQLVDLFPTLCELTGAPIPASVEGKSLAPVLRDPTAVVHDAAFSYDGSHHALRTDRWAFMRYADGAEELYDMNADPGQFTNLAKQAAHAETLAPLRRQLDQRVKAAGAGAGKAGRKQKKQAN